MELYKKLLRRMWCDNGRRPLLIVYGGIFMSIKKLVPTVLVLSLILWYLYPVRQGDVDTDANVVETMYMAPGGPVKGAMDDAVREFERRSLEDQQIPRCRFTGSYQARTPLGKRWRTLPGFW